MSILKKAARLLRGRTVREPGEVLSPNVSAYLVRCGIGRAIREKRPFLVSRLGWFEAYAIGFYEAEARITENMKTRMWNNPGIFPPTEEGFLKFHEEYAKAMPEADIFGLMQSPYEKEVITRHAPQVLLCELGALEPYLHPSPWSAYLAGLRVLVIHPFAASIASQYRNVRERLFLNPDVLPEFELTTILPPQTLSGNTGGHSSWTSALASLKDEIAAREFDVAIVGCGAYGLPAGAFVKSLGKVCIHMGGATQMLFGVTGGRWDTMDAFRLITNEHWCRPSEAERPPNFKNVENGCYW